MKNNVCAFTGHRPPSYPFGYDELCPDYKKQKAVLQQEIEKFIHAGVHTFITGMALGADTWCAELVLKLRREHPDLKLIAALPCRTQAYRWAMVHRENYRNILYQCDEIFCVGDQYTKGCMFQRNRWMVDHAQFVLAVYNGGSKGGTAYTVRYALQTGRCVTIINPETLAVERREARHPRGKTQE